MRHVHPYIVDPRPLVRGDYDIEPDCAAFFDLLKAHDRKHGPAGFHRTLAGLTGQVVTLSGSTGKMFHPASRNRDILDLLYDPGHATPPVELGQALFEFQEDGGGLKINHAQIVSAFEDMLVHGVAHSDRHGNLGLAMTTNFTACMRFHKGLNRRGEIHSYATLPCNFTGAHRKHLRCVETPDAPLVLPVFLHDAPRLSSHQLMNLGHLLERELPILARLLFEHGLGKPDACFAAPVLSPRIGHMAA